jgi:acetyl-CoA/propionyl-CoA carboxylase biotin carboxyl carrier protein
VAHVDVEGQSLEFRLAAPPAVEEAVRHAVRSEGAAVLTAPMPGRVVAVRRRAGEAVAAHEPVVVLEAMKMEQPLTAHKAGTVTGLNAAVGETVASGAVLCRIEG